VNLPLKSLVLFPVLASVLAAGPAVASPTERLGSVVIDWSGLPVRPTGVGQRRDVADRPTATLVRLESHVTTLNAGATSHPPHRHPQEELIFVRDGTVDVRINDRVQRAGPGALLFFASNDLHNLANVGDRPVTYVVIQFTTAATQAVGAPAAAPTSGLLRSAVFDWSALTVKPTQTGERRELFNSPTATFANLECHATTVNPGEAPHAPHRHADEEILVMKQGTIQVEINGVTRAAGPDSVVFFASGERHGVRNAGSKPATYYVIRLVTAATPEKRTPAGFYPGPNGFKLSPAPDRCCIEADRNRNSQS